MTLWKIEIPFDKYFSCSKVLCSKVNFSIVCYSKCSLGWIEKNISKYENMRHLHMRSILFHYGNYFGELKLKNHMHIADQVKLLAIHVVSVTSYMTYLGLSNSSSYKIQLKSRLLTSCNGRQEILYIPLCLVSLSTSSH